VSGRIRNIGIDFGTSTTLLCYLDHRNGVAIQAEPILINLDSNSLLLETVIYETPHQRLFGREARMAAENDPEAGKLIANFKMDLLVEEKRPGAEERMRQVFAHLYERYQAQRAGPHGVRIEERTFVSFPAKWSVPLREATLKAARDAGFQHVSGDDEPSAAMQFFLYYDTPELEALKREGLVRAGRPLTVLLMDMGAGTSDFVLYRATPGRAEGHGILSVWPTAAGASLGGREVDDALLSFIEDYVARNRSATKEGLETAEHRIGDIKDHKELVVSPTLAEHGEVKHFVLIQQYKKYKFLKPDAAPYRVDREVFGKLLAGHLRTFRTLVEGAITDATGQGRIAGPEDIDLVVLTGGHSKWYFVREMLAGKPVPGAPDGGGIRLPKIVADPRRILSHRDPQTTVVRGLVTKGLRLKDGPVRIEKRAANNLWYQVSIEGRSRQGNEVTIDVVRRGDKLPLKKTIFHRMPFAHTPSAIDDLLSKGKAVLQDLASGKLPDIAIEPAVVTHVVPLVGSEPATAERFAGHVLHHVLDRETENADNGAQLDLYLEIAIDEDEHIAYRGVIDLSSAKKPWAIWWGDADGIEAGEMQALWRKLDAKRPRSVEAKGSAGQ